jgi:hypothetical protein
MGKLHKDIAMDMVQSAEDENMSNKDVIGVSIGRDWSLFRRFFSAPPCILVDMALQVQVGRIL